MSSGNKWEQHHLLPLLNKIIRLNVLINSNFTLPVYVSHEIRGYNCCLYGNIWCISGCLLIQCWHTQKLQFELNQIHSNRFVCPNVKVDILQRYNLKVCVPCEYYDTPCYLNPFQHGHEPVKTSKDIRLSFSRKHLFVFSTVFLESKGWAESGVCWII